MSGRKDMRRMDLVIPYVEPPKDKDEDTDVVASMSTMLPMVAMFTRNRSSFISMVGWGAVLFSVQSWLAETPTQKKKASTPAWAMVMMSVSACLVTYLPFFMNANKRQIA